MDLTGVTHLARAGVTVLFRLSAAYRVGCTALRLFAPVGSPAETILTPVGLDRVARDPHT